MTPSPSVTVDNDGNREDLDQAERALVAVAQDTYRRRYLRHRIKAPGPLREADFIILIDLFIQSHFGRAVSVSSACIASGAPSTTALRAIGRLRRYKFVRTTGDAGDRRRSLVVLTDFGREAITRYLSAC